MAKSVSDPQSVARANEEIARQAFLSGGSSYPGPFPSEDIGLDMNFADTPADRLRRAARWTRQNLWDDQSVPGTETVPTDFENQVNGLIRAEDARVRAANPIAAALSDVATDPLIWVGATAGGLALTGKAASLRSGVGALGAVEGKGGLLNRGKRLWSILTGSRRAPSWAKPVAPTAAEVAKMGLLGRSWNIAKKFGWPAAGAYFGLKAIPGLMEDAIDVGRIATGRDTLATERAKEAKRDEFINESRMAAVERSAAREDRLSLARENAKIQQLQILDRMMGMSSANRSQSIEAAFQAQIQANKAMAQNQAQYMDYIMGRL